MAYIGKTPTAVPLTSSDITNGIITTAKIADDAISAAKLASGVGGKVLQVVTATDSTARGTSSTSFTLASSSLTLNITPSATSSKIFVTFSSNVYNATSGNNVYVSIFKDSTNLGTTNEGFCRITSGSGTVLVPATASVLDSPSSTSQLTYQVRIRTESNACELNAQGKGTITAYEIAG